MGIGALVKRNKLCFFLNSILHSDKLNFCYSDKNVADFILAKSVYDNKKWEFIGEVLC
jgi:hypothetical protein